MEKVSIIVPFYNAERNICRCVDSLIEQTYPNLEIILINDGSSDNSLIVLNKYKDRRIQIYNETNAGVSVARNLGISHASGDYILLIDSDDFINSDTVETLVNASQNGIDGALFGFKVEGFGTTDTDVLNKIIDTTGAISTATEILKHIVTIDPKKEILGYCWRILYKREIIENNEIYFDTGLNISEDYKFMLEYLIHSSRIVVVPKELYHYVVNKTSSTSKYMPTLHNDMNSVNTWIENNIYKIDDEIETSHQGCIANSYLNYVQNLAKPDSKYGILTAVNRIYNIKKRYGYAKQIKYTAKRLNCRKNAKIAFYMFMFNLDFAYFILYRIKRKLS